MNLLKNFKKDDILMLVVAFLLGYFAHQILKGCQIVEGAQAVVEFKCHMKNAPAGKACWPQTKADCNKEICSGYADGYCIGEGNKFQSVSKDTLCQKPALHPRTGGPDVYKGCYIKGTTAPFKPLCIGHPDEVGDGGLNEAECMDKICNEEATAWCTWNKTDGYNSKKTKDKKCNKLA